MNIGQPKLSERKSEAPRPPVRTGQVRRGRSTELTALSMSNGLPGHASGEQNVSIGSFLHIVPFDPTYKAGFAGHVPAKEVGCSLHLLIFRHGML